MIDPTALEALRSLDDSTDDHMLDDLVALFLRDMPAKLDQIQQAFDRSDLPNLRDGAHSLKGSASNLGARQLAALCAKLESLQEPTPDEANPLLAMLQLEFQRVCDALQAELRK